MNRQQAIEQAANEIAMALTRKGYVNIKNGKDEPRIDALYKALALPEDAERVALVERIDEQLQPIFCATKQQIYLLRDIRAYLKGGA